MGEYKTMTTRVNCKKGILYRYYLLNVLYSIVIIGGIYSLFWLVALLDYLNN